MEITNCEQYVLAELDYEQRRNERLAAENNKLFKQLDAMTKRANGYSRIINRPKTPIEALADKVMREEMLTRFTYAEVTDVKSAFSGRLLDFDEWCHDAICGAGGRRRRGGVHPVHAPGPQEDLRQEGGQECRVEAAVPDRSGRAGR